MIELVFPFTRAAVFSAFTMRAKYDILESFISVSYTKEPMCKEGEHDELSKIEFTTCHVGNMICPLYQAFFHSSKAKINHMFVWKN